MEIVIWIFESKTGNNGSLMIFLQEKESLYLKPQNTIIAIVGQAPGRKAERTQIVWMI